MYSLLSRASLYAVQVFQRMKLDDPERYMRLEHLASRTFFDGREVYGTGGGKEKRRAAIAHALSQEVGGRARGGKAGGEGAAKRGMRRA